MKYMYWILHVEQDREHLSSVVTINGRSVWTSARCKLNKHTRTLGKSGIVEFVRAPASQLPFQDSSVDEINRVLKIPGALAGSARLL